MSAERKIARTVGEAVVGDLLWTRDRWGRPPGWHLEEVQKVGRAYAYTGDKKYPNSWHGYSRETGYSQTVNNYTPGVTAYGYEDRRNLEWMTMRQAMMKKLDTTTDVEVLRTVAFALGFAKPVTYDTPPEQESAP